MEIEEIEKEIENVINGNFNSTVTANGIVLLCKINLEILKHLKQHK